MTTFLALVATVLAALLVRALVLTAAFAALVGLS